MPTVASVYSSLHICPLTIHPSGPWSQRDAVQHPAGLHPYRRMCHVGHLSFFPCGMHMISYCPFISQFCFIQSCALHSWEWHSFALELQHHHPCYLSLTWWAWRCQCIHFCGLLMAWEDLFSPATLGSVASSFMLSSLFFSLLVFRKINFCTIQFWFYPHLISLAKSHGWLHL